MDEHLPTGVAGAEEVAVARRVALAGIGDVVGGENFRQSRAGAVGWIDLSEFELVGPPLAEEHVDAKRVAHDTGFGKVFGFFNIVSELCVPELFVLILNGDVCVFSESRCSR
jgi:hypothetical protein